MGRLADLQSRAKSLERQIENSRNTREDLNDELEEVEQEIAYTMEQENYMKECEKERY